MTDERKEVRRNIYSLAATLQDRIATLNWQITTGQIHTTSGIVLNEKDKAKLSTLCDSIRSARKELLHED